jgi:hypothetical protein
VHGYNLLTNLKYDFSIFVTFLPFIGFWLFIFSYILVIIHRFNEAVFCILIMIVEIIQKYSTSSFHKQYFLTAHFPTSSANISLISY